MDACRILVMDLNPTPDLANALQGILATCVSPRFLIQRESTSLQGSTQLRNDLAEKIPPNSAELILMVLSAKDLNRISPIIGSIVRRGTPSVAVVDGGSLEDRMHLLQLGACDFITPPLQSVDIIPRLWRLLEQKNQDGAVAEVLREKLGMRQLIGSSPVFLAAIEKIPAVAKCDVTVLITGETGTGKELCARAIHYLSPRSSQPFIPVSCGAIPADLIENELFGHVQGAFTSAHASQPGLIQEVKRGTLFLDEVDCLPVPAQVKLLRILQEREYRQLGSTKVQHADIRVVAATNIDLDQAVSGGTFRKDLYYRLNVVPIDLPPLRERKEDIPSLSRHFLMKYAREFGKRFTDLTSEAIQRLLAYDWPGNVRELENVIERAAIFSTTILIDLEDIRLLAHETPAVQDSFREAKARAVSAFEKSYIRDLLLAFEGNISKSARAAGKNRRAFWELIRKHRIDVKGFRLAAHQE